ncbi:polysaccharide deacetylase, partial [Streptomyces sp. FT05W]
MILLAVLGGALAGCASPEATRAGTAVLPTAPEKSATASPSPSRPPESGPPVLAPGPGGLTPV